MNAYMMIGEVLRPQGVRGEAKVRPYAADPDCFHDWDTLYLRSGDTYTPIASDCRRVHDGFVYLTLEGCTSPEDVEKLRGRELYITREQAGELDEDENFITDLIGLKAVDEQGREIGTLSDVLQNGPVDVYVFKCGRRSMMAPALKAVFPAVDTAQGVIRVASARLEEVAVWDE